MRRGSGLGSLFILLLACDGGRGGGVGTPDLHTLPGPPAQDLGPADLAPCSPPGMPTGSDVQLAPEFAQDYAVYELGMPAGIPNPLGGMVVDRDDPNTLLIAGSSERSDGAIYSIKVKRDACGHITGFDGAATRKAATANIDANIIYGADNLLLFTEWPLFHFSQLTTTASATTRRTDLRPLGVMDSGDSGP